MTTRYDMKFDGYQSGPYVCPDGKWVRYEDHELAMAKLELHYAKECLIALRANDPRQPFVEAAKAFRKDYP